MQARLRSSAAPRIWDTILDQGWLNALLSRGDFRRGFQDKTRPQKILVELRPGSRHLSAFSVAATFLRHHKIGCLIVPSGMFVAAHAGRIALTVDYVGAPFGLRH